MLGKVYAFLLFHTTKTVTSNSKLYTTKILNDEIAGLWLYNSCTPQTKQILVVGYLNTNVDAIKSTLMLA